MFTFTAPDMIEASLSDGVLKYDEVVDVSAIDEEDMDGFIETTELVFEQYMDEDEYYIERHGDDIEMGYEVEGDEVDATSVLAVESLLMLKGMGEDIDDIVEEVNSVDVF